MKRLVVTLAVLIAVSVSPLAVYASNGHHYGHRNWDQRAHHERIWREHEREWAEHDREWREHQRDAHWRKAHAREWHEWYKWHESDENEFHLHISGDRFDFDINR